MKRGKGVSRDRGAGSVEWVGLGLLAAAIVFVLATGTAIPGISAQYNRALCVLTGGNCPSNTPGNSSNPERNYEPPSCRVSSTSGTYGMQVQLGFVKIGGEYSAVTQRMSDGKIMVTLTDGQSLGAEGGQEGTVDGRRIGKSIDPQAKGSGKASVTGKWANGDTYMFENQADYDRWKEALEAEVTNDLAKYDPEGGYAMGAAIKDMNTPDMRPPDITFDSKGLEGSVVGSFGLTGQRAPTDVTDKPATVGTGTGGNASVKLGGTVLVKHNSKTGEVSDIYQLTAEGTYEGKQVGKGTGQKFTGTGSMEVVRDAKTGALKKIVFTQDNANTGTRSIGGTTPGNGEVPTGTGEYNSGQKNSQTTVTTLEFQNDADRRIGEDWLAGRGSMPSQLMAGWNGAPTDDPGEDADPFDRLLYDNAQVTRATYRGEQHGGKLGWSIPIRGITLGQEMSLDVSSDQVASAQYLGAPNDGQRSFIPFERCQAGG